MGARSREREQGEGVKWEGREKWKGVRSKERRSSEQGEGAFWGSKSLYL